MESMHQDKSPLIDPPIELGESSRRMRTRPRKRRLPSSWVCLTVFATLLVLGLSGVVAFLARSVRGMEDKMNSMDGRGIDANTFARFNLLEQYSAAAYCGRNTNSSAPRTRIACPVGNCPLVESADTWAEVEFENSFYTDVTGFVAVDNTNKLVVISFRGSTSKKNFITDANFTKGEADLCAGCYVHWGFWLSWMEARNATLTALMNTARRHPDYQMVVTGHSLGGAIATFCAAEVRKMGWSAALYTFGSPRVGDSKTADFITSQPGGNYRITHYNDLVPRLPPLYLDRTEDGKTKRDDDNSGFGFAHVSPEYYIRTGNNITVTWSDIDTYNGLVNFRGNTGQAVPSIEAHRWYFNAISACA